MNIIHSQIIDELGGPTAVGELCKCTKGAVSQWRVTGFPQPRELYLRAIRPDVFLMVESRFAVDPESAPVTESKEAA